MNIQTYIRVLLITLAVFLAIDLFWLGVIAESTYEYFLEDLLREEGTIWLAAGLFYLLFNIGLMYFAIMPSIAAESPKLAAKNGALFGFFTYMTYELTNYAVIDGWPFGIVIIDIAWGCLLGGMTAFVVHRIIT